MGHRRLAAVVLPVRVRDEARRGVERERGWDAGDVGRVQEERALHALEQEEAEHRDGAEGEERERVDRPGLLARGVDSGDAVDEPLDREEHAVARRRPVAENAREVCAEHPRDDGEERDECEQLECGAQSFSGLSSA